MEPRLYDVLVGRRLDLAIAMWLAAIVAGQHWPLVVSLPISFALGGIHGWCTKREWDERKRDERKRKRDERERDRWLP